MDYGALKLVGRQIRLMTIEPVPVGIAAPDRPIHCRMEVRTQPLPVNVMIADSGSLPPNYISFDHYIENPPPEVFGAGIRRDVAKIEQQKKPGRAGRLTQKALNKICGILSLPTSTANDILIPVDDIPNLLTREDLLNMIEDIENGVPEISITRHESGSKRYGKLPLKDINPIFRPPRERPAPVEEPDPNNYVALSYTWRPETPATTIFINEEAVKVGENLAAALQRFRDMAYFQSGGRVWIDALCINQGDNAEKEKQIEMMSTIYQLAGNIIVWIGPEDNESEKAIDSLELLSRFHRTEYIEACDGSDALTATTWRNMAQLRLRTTQQQILSQLDVPEEAAAIYYFFTRPYWRRLWIIQELAMGRAGMPIVCGRRVTQWRYIRDALLLLAPVLERIKLAAANYELSQTGADGDIASELGYGNPLKHVLRIAQLEIAGHRKWLPHIDQENLPLYAPAVTRLGPLPESPLGQALLLASQARCSNPHDRVYGMLSIPGLPRLGIKVDYAKEVGEVFLEFTAACVRNGSLDFLSLLDGLSVDSPSWVPDYSAPPRRRITGGHAGGQTGGTFPTFFGAFGDCYPPKVEQRSLLCSAKVVDEVVTVNDLSHSNITTKSGLVGQGPPTTQTCDVVIIIVGYGKPVIATAAEKDEGGKPVTWRLRGEAYVSGMMKGEMMAVNCAKPELMLGAPALGLERLIFV